MSAAALDVGTLVLPADRDPVAAAWTWATWAGAAPWGEQDPKVEPWIFGGGPAGCRLVRFDPVPPVLAVDDRPGSNVRYAACHVLTLPFGRSWWLWAPGVRNVGCPSTQGVTFYAGHVWGPCARLARAAILLADGAPDVYWVGGPGLYTAAGWVTAVLVAHLDYLRAAAADEDYYDAADDLARRLLRRPDGEHADLLRSALDRDPLADPHMVTAALQCWAQEATTFYAGAPVPGMAWEPWGVDGSLWCRLLSWSGDALRRLWEPSGAAYTAAAACDPWEA